jgi:glutaredoxin
MKNKNIFIYVIIVILLAIGLSIWSYKSDLGSTTTNEDLILFYGDTCPHCLKVEEFLETQNGLAERLGLVRKEVYNDAKNQRLLTTKAKVCGLDTSSIGVPFLWNNGACLIGDVDIINFFNTQNNVQ